MRPLFVITTAALLAAAPTFAQTAPAPSVTASAAEPSATPPATATTPAAGPSAALMDSLVSKTRIYGVTKVSGRRYLCHLTSGDHGVYMAQTFHFAGPPKSEKEKLAATQGQPSYRTRYRTIGSGRNRIRVPITTEQPGRVTKGRTVTVKTPTTIPDVDAVKMLLAGVAGNLKNPEEVSDSRDLLTAADIKFVQELAPPVKSAKSATPTTTTPATATTPPTNAWTLTTLWPLAKDAPAASPAAKKRTRRSRKAPA